MEPQHPEYNRGLHPIRNMASERWQRVEEIVETALTKPEAERLAYLTAACGDDASLRADVESRIRSAVSTAELPPDEARAGADGVVRDRASLAGTIVGRFAIEARLGAGGMGEVYRAYDTHLKRTVAVKRLLFASADRPARGDLLREAQRASALNHPGIASVYDVFEHQGELFLVMEYIDGATLGTRMREPLAIDAFSTIALQCAQSLGAAHQKGILHGDLKPSNIMLTRDDGQVKLCDFGVARRVPRAGAADESLATISTQPGGAAGTPAYMAPETILDQAVDARADLFSLGVVFYEMLARQNPFAASSPLTTIDRVLHHTPETISRLNPTVSTRLSRLVHRMLEKDPARRPSSAIDVAVELAAFGTEVVGAATRRRRRRLVSLSLAGLAFVGLATFATPRFDDWRRGAGGVAALPARLNVAVLPFSESATDASKPFFSQGFTEAIAMRLSRLTLDRPLQVASLADVRTRSVTTPREAREQLGATLVLTGSLGYSANGIVVTTSVIDTATGQSIRSETATVATADPLMAQDRAVETAVRLLGIELGTEERRRLLAHDTAQPGAYDFYLQARGYLLNYDRLESIDNAVAVFRRALEIDRRYALAYAGLGQAYWRKYELTRSAAWVEPARAACEGALGIEAALAEAHGCLGMVLTGTGEYEKAAAEYAVALAAEPTNDVFHAGLATAYERLGRAGDAEAAYRRAIELRPHYWAGYNRLGAYYYNAGRHDDAVRMFQQVIALAPDSFRGHNGLGAAYFMKDRTTEATAAFERSLAIRSNYQAASNLGTLLYYEGQYRRSAELFRQALSLQRGDYRVWGYLAGALERAGSVKEAAEANGEARRLIEERLAVNPRDALLHVELAGYLAGLGDKAGARRSLERSIQLSPTDARTSLEIATLYEELDERDQALAWLARAIERGQAWREVDRRPGLAKLREDPRFHQLRRAR
jgi:tetratricopeptide (TPR) repeat protein/predicted Ser/Thr protein kinase